MTRKLDVPPKLLLQIQAVSAKRPKTVLDHILKHGSITTDELKEKYGYDHPPRAARDVREQGIPLKTTMVTGPNGRRMAAYTLDLEAVADAAKAGGRRAFPNWLKDALIERDGVQCSLCGAPFPARALQIDHRVPYEVGGDVSEIDPADFMLVCGSCNRAKSWSCEHCENWQRVKEVALCESCYWASPTSYSHIALEERRILTVSWVGEEAAEYDALAEKANGEGAELADYVKDALRGEDV
jgi:hypothetical protein